MSNTFVPTPHDHLDAWIIEGITAAGQIFRPTNWPLRLCGCLASYHRQRLKYSPLLMPTSYQDHASVRLSVDALTAHPDICEHIFRFAHFHQLVIHEVFKTS